MKTYFVYLLECADGTYYTGCTTDLKHRLYAHNNLKAGAKYTKARRPVKLVYSEEYSTQRGALQREHQLKQYKRSQKKRLIFSR